MKRILLEGFRPGAFLPAPLFHGSGLVLIPAGHALDEPRRRAIAALGLTELHLPDPDEDLAPFLFECWYRPVDLDALRGETPLPFDLYDSREALLASQGLAIDEKTSELLARAVEGGLYRRRTREERGAGAAEEFLRLFPFEETPGDTDTQVMRRELASEEPVQGPIGSVLVAEDDRRIREILVRFIAQAGHHVREAANGEEALREARARPFDVAVLDIMMPLKNGLEVCRELKSRGRDAPAVIICTAKDSRPEILTALKAGADEYIVKPFRRRQIVEKIAELMERRGRRA